MHAKTDSEVTSLAPSSPAPDRSPRRPVYYVQSPSRDSHDGEKTTASFHSTPVLSPMASPRHSHSSIGPQSRESSSSRFSGSMKPGGSSRRGGKGSAAAAGVQKHGEKPWKDDFSVIEEEGILDHEQERRGISRRCCYILVFVLGFIVLFTFFSLILWGASRNQTPVVTMKSIKFENFNIQAGTDASLVPTDMATLNATVKFAFRNRGTFFGVHVSATPFHLIYDGQLIMASGDMKKFYQSRKGQRDVDVVVLGNKVPLYGGGPILTGPQQGNNTAAAAPVPLGLNFTLQARAYVLGKLVNPKFDVEVQCAVNSKLNTPISLKKLCQLY